MGVERLIDPKKYPTIKARKRKSKAYKPSVNKTKEYSPCTCNPQLPKLGCGSIWSQAALMYGVQFGDMLLNGLGNSIIGAIAQRNNETKSDTPVEETNTPTEETVEEKPEDAVKKILSEANLKVSKDILNQIVEKYPTMKAIPTAGLTLKQRVINLAKGLSFDATTDDFINAKKQSQTSTQTYSIKMGDDEDEGTKVKNGYIQFAQEQIELYDNDNDGKINLTEYAAKELTDVVNLDNLNDQEVEKACEEIEKIFNVLDADENNQLDNFEIASLSYVRSTFRPQSDVGSDSYTDTTYQEWNNIDDVLKKLQEAVDNLPADKLNQYNNLLKDGKRSEAFILLKDNCNLNPENFDDIGHFVKRFDKSVIGFYEHINKQD